MRITDKKLLLALILFVSVLWQPSHHILMNQGMSMNFGVHALVTMIPFLSIFFALGKSIWSQ